MDIHSPLIVDVDMETGKNMLFHKTSLLYLDCGAGDTGGGAKADD